MIATDTSPETRAVADLLAQVSYGAEITYAQITHLTGIQVLRRRYVLSAAFRVVMRESGAVFATVRRVGYRRLRPDEMTTVGATARARIRRTAGRGARAMTAGITAANDLDNEAKLRCSNEIAVLGMLRHMASDREVRKRFEAVAPRPVTEIAAETMAKLTE